MIKNAKILQSRVLGFDLFKIIKYGLLTFDKNHNPEFILNVIRFTDMVLLMLSEYSKNNILTITTHKKKRVKKSKNFGEREQDLEDHMEFLSDEEDDDEEVFVEKQFSFEVEMATLIDYQIIENLVFTLEKANRMDSSVIDAVAYFCNRIAKNPDTVWVFYQMSTMNAFHEFLKENRDKFEMNKLVKVIKFILGKFF